MDTELGNFKPRVLKSEVLGQTTHPDNPQSTDIITTYNNWL